MPISRGRPLARHSAEIEHECVLFLYRGSVDIGHRIGKFLVRRGAVFEREGPVDEVPFGVGGAHDGAGGIEVAGGMDGLEEPPHAVWQPALESLIENEILDRELDAVGRSRYGKINQPVGDQLRRAVAHGHVPQDEPMLVDIDLPGQVLQRKREQRMFDLGQSQYRAGLVVQLGARGRTRELKVDRCLPAERQVVLRPRVGKIGRRDGGGGDAVLERGKPLGGVRKNAGERIHQLSDVGAGPRSASHAPGPFVRSETALKVDVP